MKKRPWVVHPFLVALLPSVFLYSRNIGAVELSSLWIPIGLSLGAALAVWAILRLCRLDGARSGLILSVGLVLFFSFGHGVRLTARLGLARVRPVQERITLGVELVALGSAIGLVVWKPGIALQLNSASNAASIALVGLSMMGIAGQTWGRSRDQPPTFEQPVAPSLEPRSGKLPDVYFLVLDAYGRSDVLKGFYDFDNGPFLDRLERKGFVVARRSRANYCQTALSLAATLNLRYLDEFAGNGSSNRLPLKQLIAESAVFQAFRQEGYRLATFASGFDATEGLSSDLSIAPSSNLQTFHALVADQTPLWLMLGRQATHEPFRMHRDRILKVFDELPASSHASKSPTFTFAHVLAPHPPFVFGADGRDVSGSEGLYTLNDSEGWCRISGHKGSEDYARRYRDQVSYVTRRVEDAIDRILASSTSPPIIIIQGDHGPGAHFDSGSPQPNDLRERMGILNACLVPEPARKRIGDAITPVNTFRVVLDECLGSKLGPIEDRSYYSSYLTPYAFIDVTGEFQ
jgi:Sulfatase